MKQSKQYNGYVTTHYLHLTARVKVCHGHLITKRAKATLKQIIKINLNGRYGKISVNNV